MLILASRSEESIDFERIFGKPCVDILVIVIGDFSDCNKKKSWQDKIVIQSKNVEQLHIHAYVTRGRKYFSSYLPSSQEDQHVLLEKASRLWWAAATHHVQDKRSLKDFWFKNQDKTERTQALRSQS